MQGLTKMAYIRLIMATALGGISFSAAAGLSGSASISASVTINSRFIVSFPASLPAINIDPSNLTSGSNYTYDSGTGTFTTTDNATQYCVFSNAPANSGQSRYSIAVDGTTAAGTTALKGTSATNNAVLPYTLIIKDGASNSNTFTINKDNASTKVLGSTNYVASRTIGCTGTGQNGKGTVSFQISASDWQSALADSYSANITLTVTQV